MPRIYNTIGSLAIIKSHLLKNGITEFRSLKELIQFREHYSDLRKGIITEQERLLNHERTALESEIPLLTEALNALTQRISDELSKEIEVLRDKTMTSSPPRRWSTRALIHFFSTMIIEIKLKQKELFFKRNISKKTKRSRSMLHIAINRSNELNTDFENQLKKSCFHELTEIDRKWQVINEINPSILGAIGENKVLKKLRDLPDYCHVINDYKLFFEQPIYHRKKGDYIQSIQIDHLVISPAGIFIIETKNWSKDSINNVSRYSPIDQIIRSGYAIYRSLKTEVAESSLSFVKHHWSYKKIPIKNLLVFVSNKPIWKFEHVTILSVEELPDYIKSKRSIFSLNETDNIASFLIRLSNDN